MSNSLKNVNPKKSTTIIFWLLAILITLSSAIYQRRTGPTYPISGEMKLNNDTIRYSLLRSHNTGSDAKLTFESINNNGKIIDTSETLEAVLIYKRYLSHDEWKTVKLKKEKNNISNKMNLIAYIPHQPAAGKVIYKIGFTNTKASSSSEKYIYLTEKPVIIRFKGAVPAHILVPHIFFMFFAMLFSTRTGIEGLSKRSFNLNFLTGTTIILLFLGGLILGPIVQKYAFDAYWTGFPWGTDLTDNKTAIGFIFWIFAFWRVRVDLKNNTKFSWKWVLLASVIMMIVYLIPHSAFGSEIDHTKLIEN